MLDCHLMVDNPVHHFPELAESGGDSVTFHVEAVDDAGAVIAQAREHGLGVGVAFNPGTERGARRPKRRTWAPTSASACRSCPATPARRSCRGRLRADRAAAFALSTATSRSTAASTRTTSRAVRAAGADLLVVGSGIFARDDLPRAYRRLVRSRRGMSLERALELAERGRRPGLPEADGRRRRRPSTGEIVGEGATERAAAARRGRRARGGRRACPRRDALRDDGALRAPRLDAAVRGRDRRGGDRAGRRRARSTRTRRPAAGSSGCARPAIEVELDDALRGAAPERGVADVDRRAAGRSSPTRPRVTLDGRVDRAGLALGLGRGVAPARARASRRLGRGGRRHGHGPGWTNPRLDARDVPVAPPAAPARLRHADRSRRARSSSCAPGRSRRSCARSPPRASSRSCSRAGRRSPARSSAPDLVDKVLLFVAPTLSGAGPGVVDSLDAPRRADAPREPPDRRGRAARGVPPRAVSSLVRFGRVHRARARGRASRLVREAAGSSWSARRPRRPVGDSVALDGVCLTVVDGAADRLSFDAVPETLARVKPFRRARQRRAGAAGGRAARRPLRPGTRRRRRHGRCGRRRGRRRRGSRSTRPPSCSATASRRARSRSRASR